MERRSLLDDDDGQAEGSVNVFDDALEVEEDEEMVADGFRPASNHDREGGERQEASSSSTRTVSEHYAPGASAGPSRSSTRKSRGHENPFASPEDDNSGPLLHRTPSGRYTPLVHRSVSSASSHQFARSNSQRLGAGGPSHPYGMYPQGTLARTASIATSSTARPTRSVTPRNGPQHPYSLYPQGIGDDLDDEPDAMQSQVPIGFPGLSQSFQRQRGPDGEEQDIVGFYGHTEQLPPYTRYPEDGPEKPLLSAPEPPAASHSHAPVQGTDPSMSLMHSPIQPAPQPQQQSMTDESELNRQTSIQSRRTTEHRADSTDDSIESRKVWSEKSWREKRRTRVLGVPCWWYLIAVGLLVFILVVVSGAIGGFVAGQKKAEQKYNVATTTGYDASVISTPTSAPPIPTGTYTLDLGRPQETAAQCLVMNSQRPAWDCNLAYGNELAINVAQPHEGNQTGAYLFYKSNGDETGLTYGSQASQMNTSFSPFFWVQDKDDTESGAALYFQAHYDKLVVLPENALDLSSKKIKRDGGWWDTQVAGPAAKPWYCFWNNTLVEGFVYVHKQIGPLPSYTASITPTAPYSTPAWAAQMTAPPTQTITTTLTMSSTTAKYTGPVSAFPKWLYESYPNFNYTAYTATQTPYPQKRDDGDDYHDDSDDDSDDDSKDDLDDLLIYPYKVKIEERRERGSPLPYCIQYQVLNDGVINWIPNDAGQQIVVQLSEKNPPFKPLMFPPGDDRRKSRRRREVEEGSCHCQWESNHNEKAP